MKKILIIVILLLSINVKAINTSTIVMDVDSGRILYENNAYEKRLVASTTKIMTFVVAYIYGEEFLDVYVEAGEEILPMYGTSIYLNYQEKMLLKDLLYGLILRSGNDASMVIANFIAGSEENFVKLMNDKAQKLGMHNTIFNNPHGLDEVTRNYSTAYDMALLSKYANTISFYKEVTGTKYYKVQTDNKSYAWTNRNKLLFTYPYLISGKTGYTPSAGKTFVSSSKKNNLHLTIVSLNDDNTYENHRLLYEEMFNTYNNYVLVNKNNFTIDDSKYKNKVYIKENITYPLKKEELNNITKKVIINKNNDILGTINVYLKDKEIGKTNIYLKKETIKKKDSLFTKIKLLFKKLFQK